MSSFPDANVWLALIWNRHSQSASALEWFQRAEGPVLFCRFTQLTVLRLLTTEAVLGADVRTMRGAWAIWDRISGDRRFEFLPEPRDFERGFRKAANLPTASPKAWADCYLSAFAVETSTRLVTFDKALARRTVGSILLR